MIIDKKIIDKAVDTWGIDIQTNMAIEEMAELIKEILKFKRGQDNYLEMADEIADVYITLEYVKKIHDTKDGLIQDYIDKKLERLEFNIDNN